MKVPDVDIDERDIAEALRLPDSFAVGSEHPASKDPKHWSLGPMIVTRDSGLLDQSNRDALISHLRKDHPVLRKDWRITSCGHWAVGWVEHLSFRVLNEDGSPTAIFRVLKSWFAALSNYPVADDNDYSRRQHDAAIENIMSEGQISEDEAGRVYSWLWDNNQRELEDHDDTGAYPSRESIEAALKAIQEEDEEDE